MRINKLIFKKSATQEFLFGNEAEASAECGLVYN
jgi:hypothetical protein